MEGVFKVQLVCVDSTEWLKRQPVGSVIVKHGSPSSGYWLDCAKTGEVLWLEDPVKKAESELS